MVLAFRALHGQAPLCTREPLLSVTCLYVYVYITLTCVCDAGLHIECLFFFLLLFFQALLWLSRQGEALYEDLFIQSSDGQEVRIEAV